MIIFISENILIIIIEFIIINSIIINEVYVLVIILVTIYEFEKRILYMKINRF